jgi:hypothetical protein
MQAQELDLMSTWARLMGWRFDVISRTERNLEPLVFEEDRSEGLRRGAART